MQRSMIFVFLWLVAGTVSVRGQDAASGQEKAVRPELWRALERIAAERGVAPVMKIVVDHIAEMTRQRPVPGRYTRVVEGLEHPWEVPEHARRLRDLLLGPANAQGGPTWGAALAEIASWMDLTEWRSPSAASEDEGLRRLGVLWEEVASPELVGQDLLVKLSEFMQASHDEVAVALADLHRLRREKLFKLNASFRESWYQDHFPEAPDAAARTAAIQAYLQLLVEVDRPRIFAVASVLTRLTEPAFVKGLRKRLTRLTRPRKKLAEFRGNILGVAGKTASSRVVIGGSGKTTYSGAAALIIDLGGKDTYRRAAVVDSADALVSIVLDLGGDDVYSGPDLGPATSICGVSILLDLKGKDRYETAGPGEAATFGGFAMLADLKGNDTYEGGAHCQGHATTGVALLYDFDGRDRYDAAAYAQGSGIGPGFAALVDTRGDDRYVADLQWPDVYGDSGPNVHHGASQGYATGVRPTIPGGFAVLIDEAGKDFYRAGNFSQGGGYYFAFGLMYDGGGDDENVGTRYSQGFGVHQAVGMRWDRAGNDVYRQRCPANCGSAWDEGVGYLVDERGDDTYETGSLCIGAAANTAIAVFFDGGGKDVYRASDQSSSQGGTADSSYHNKPALALFLDLGGGKDSYSRTGRKNGQLATDEGCGVFYDSGFKSLKKLLTSRKPLRR